MHCAHRAATFREVYDVHQVHGDGQCPASRAPRSSVRLFPVAERMQDHLFARDVVAQAVVAEPDSPLTVASVNTRKFFDLVVTGDILRVVAENWDELFEHCRKLSLAADRFSGLPLECGSGEDAERCGHPWMVTVWSA